MLEIKGVKKSYGNKIILRGISFTCKPGEVVGIFGRNGSGKSSLFKIVHGTLKADAVAIYLNGQAVRPKEVIPSKSIAYLPQDTFLPKNLKVRNLIPLFYPDGDDQDKIFYAKGVSGFENRSIGKLSLGQLRYLELLLIGNLQHPYLMLDEPFSMIEPLYKEIIKEFLTDLKKKKGIMVTDHYYHDVLEVSNKNFVIKEGNKIDVNHKEDLVNHNYLSTERS